MNLKSLLRRRTKDAGRFVGRMRTHDVAFQYRMGAGVPGDVNRTHPATIEPTLIDSSAPPQGYGLAVVVDSTTQGVRQMASGDSSLDAIYGITVRPFPLQQQSATNYGAQGIGSATPPTNGVMDTLRSGYIMTQLSGANQPVKGGRVYVWVAASSGSHIQGGFEAQATGGSTIELAENTTFNGPADANGVVELAFNI